MGAKNSGRSRSPSSAPSGPITRASRSVPTGFASPPSCCPGGPKAPADSREVQILEAETGKELRRFATGGGAFPNLAYSPDGSRLAVAGCGPVPIRVWDVRSGKKLLDLKGGGGLVQLSRLPSAPMARSWPAHRWTESCGSGMSPPSNRAETARRLGSWRRMASRLRGVAWGADGRSISTSDMGGKFLSWEVTTQENRRSDARAGRATAFAPTSSEDPARFCAAFALGREIELRVWDQTGKILFTAKDESFKLPNGVGLQKTAEAEPQRRSPGVLRDEPRCDPRLGDRHGSGNFPSRWRRRILRRDRIQPGRPAPGRRSGWANGIPTARARPRPLSGISVRARRS